MNVKGKGHHIIKIGIVLLDMYFTEKVVTHANFIFLLSYLVSIIRCDISEYINKIGGKYTRDGYIFLLFSYVNHLFWRFGVTLRSMAYK